jgi:hypothetical protein
MLTAMPFLAIAPCWPHVATSVRSGAPRSAGASPVGNLAAVVSLPALVLERRLNGKPDCPAGTGLRDARGGDRYLLGSDRLRPAAEDRPHF